MSRMLASLAIAASLTAGVSPAWADRLALEGSHLYYDQKGSGPPVVLIHGGNLDGGMWDDDVEVLATRWRVVRYDVRPYGRSGPVTPGYAWHEDLRALFDHLKIERAHLVGLSLGARVATNFALAYPARVDRLVLAGPGVDGWTWDPDPRLADLVAAIKAKDAARATDLWLQHPYMAPAMKQPVVARKIRALSMRNEHVWLGALSPDRVPAPPALERLKDIRAPTLVIVGTLDVPDILRIADRIVADVPGARKQVVPDVGHMVNMEAPAIFQKSVLDFLAAAPGR